MPSKKKKPSKTVRKYVQSAIDRQIETKYVTYNPNAVSISTRALGVIVDRALNATGRGNGPKERNGDITKTIGVKGKFFIQGADTTNVIRIILYRPRKVGDLMTNATVELHTHIEYQRFIVYRDFYVNTSQTSDDVAKFAIDKSFKMGLLNNYDGASATDIKSGDLYLYMVSDSALASHPLLYGHLVATYKDA